MELEKRLLLDQTDETLKMILDTLGFLIKQILLPPTKTQQQGPVYFFEEELPP